MKSNLIDVSVIFVHQTEKGLAIKQDEEEDKVIWLPLSQIEIDPPDPKRGNGITVTMEEWLAKDKQLI